ncbi:DinB family protein [Mucilaginibacter sp.]|uniref:DinB family protein n=1 Tax=Mucilaginibacter sp. TaxID=1882438 RepID=UPI003D0D5A6A
MKKLSLLITMLVIVFASNKAHAQFTQSQMVDEWQRAKAYTKAYLSAMPEDGYAYKPTPEMRSFAQQMLHLADANYFFSSAASGKENPLGKASAEKTIPQTKEATTKAVLDSYDFAISALQGMTADQLLATTKFANKDITKSGLFGKGFEHQTHHRGQTTVYLRLKGVTPPPEMLF